MYYEVIPVRLFREDGGVLTYAAPENDTSKPQVGQIVEIPLGKNKTYGIISKKVSSVNFKTKPITRIIYNQPLPAHILKSIFWLSAYYDVPLPQAAKTFLPQGIGKNRRKLSEEKKDAKKSATSNTIPLNAAQKRALGELKNIKTNTRLLFGVTGSGKTNIYLELTKETLASGRSVILLVPEIALTSQLVQIFEKTFGKQISLIHSSRTEAERHKIWEKILSSNASQVVIGARSALLSPVQNLGLIIIDEAHEEAYFQENTPRYSALRLASFMASTTNIPCILGTATPLVSDFYLAKSKNALVTLSEKAKTSAKTPDIKIIDLKDSSHFTRNRYFSNELLDSIARNLNSNRQTLIFHNRRGSASITICEKCGWQALCPNCLLPLTLHADSYKLICHTCGYKTKVPVSCPECKNPNIIHKGFGTKLLETEIKKLFKDAKVARFDADNKKSETLNENYDRVKDGEFDIIIGTQTLAKGLDLPLLATVGVVQADSGLSLPDFSAEEKTFHLLSQVLGRIGRGHIDTAEAFVQTYQPESEVIKAGVKSDYLAFYDYILKRRKVAHFPPFYYLAKLSITYKTEAACVKNINVYHRAIKNSSKIFASAPTPAFHEHTTSGYTWQLVLRAKSRNDLLSLIKSLPKNPHLHLSIDPPSLL